MMTSQELVSSVRAWDVLSGASLNEQFENNIYFNWLFIYIPPYLTMFGEQ